MAVMLRPFMPHQKQLKRRRVLLSSWLPACLLMLPSAGHAATFGTEICVPKQVTARVLRSANPNDTADRWRGADYVGLSWTFVPRQSLKNDTGTYLKGKLLPPYRPAAGQTYGAYLKAKGQSVWVLASEWHCQP